MIDQIELKNVKITGGYFYEKQQMNENVTIPAVYKRFYDTGRVDAFKLKWRNGEPNRPHIFWDSDVAKWIEGAAYSLIHKRDENLENLIDSIVADIETGQTPDGYFNSYYQTVEYANRFTVRDNHELYCAGHLMEGAVAYHKATGKRNFLDAMCRYADHIADVFTAPDRDKNFTTPGHEEIELALVKLYKETNEKKYLELSKFFVDTRGTINLGTQRQDHLPLREQTTAEGHSVRCLYLFAGAADIAREYGDEHLKKACEAVFENVVNKRMYVTGGIGANFAGESFSYDYDLPNELAYAETCASIAMVYFCQRMYLLTGEKKYMDVIELQIYNSVLSGISLYGDRFFYCNPLEVHPERRDNYSSDRRAQFAPEYERPDYFNCSCCPPNLVRFIASLGQYMYHVDSDKIYVNLYNSSEFNYNGVKITQETDYPRDGKINFKVSTNKPINILFRKPDWRKGYSFDNATLPFTSDDNGYINITIRHGGDYQFILDLEMPVVELYANPQIHYCAGRAAIKRGPIVYCAEGIDNGTNLKSVVICKDADYQCEQSEINGNEIVKITCAAEFMRETADELYSTTPFKTESGRLTLIPYTAWANRGKTEMNVWLLK
ncbi:MAG: glycoside hydrolase family 127 protein [Oscillospiraceae bacterium]|nr:glycoside hydrolase family 127 protein [Oscillospiraceae bacterium]